MAKGKYNEEIVNLICQTIEDQGTDKAGYETAKINKSTFYEWMVARPDFANRVAKARQAFSKREDDEVREALTANMRSYAKHGLVQKYKNTKRIYNGEEKRQNLINTIVEEKEFHKGVPQWVQEKWQGRDPDELSSIKNLAKAGYYTQEQLEAIVRIFEEQQSKIRRVLAGDLNVFDS